ncbi:soluble lytic murein transglycosylase [Hypnocyclicus thermotrophus]|uniref:Soluble lytic murein transglycosylase n=1 Tax=Hypnocyclicus thermotrophus TaxID=1627895 RepID=A0AA46DYY4_9FUSO|nr:transglycosylase SLT domain-containing protein [Hypnocyclicus thermotrophus]TDT70619.1 soluble lytic murein transglycosylase [Hypnocyclicus thermotrophus]
MKFVKKNEKNIVFEIGFSKFSFITLVLIIVLGVFLVISEIAQRNREIEKHRKNIEKLQNEIIEKLEIIEEKNRIINKKDEEIEDLKEYKNILDAVKELSYNKLDKKEQLKLSRAIYDTSQKYRYDWRIPVAFIMTESSFRANIISGDPSYGLMQIKYTTAKAIAKKMGEDVKNKKELFDVEKNVEIGTTYLLEQIMYFKDIKKAIIAYNLGPTKTKRLEKKYGDFETEYLKKIYKNYNYLKNKYKT